MHKISYLKNFLADSDRVTAALNRAESFNTNYPKDFLADSDRVTAALNRAESFNTNYPKDFLADSDRVTAALNRAESFNTNYPKNFLADSDRVTAALNRAESFNTNYPKNFLADSDRVTAALNRAESFNTNYPKDFLADSDRTAAALNRAESFNTNYPKNFLADSDRVTAALDRVKPLRSNCVETCYNRDLAYRGEEETNHATEDYNEEVKLNLELEKKSIFGDGLDFSVANKEISSNITFNIGQITQVEKIEMKSEISNSQVGVLNTGEMQAKSITASISTSVDPSQYQITEGEKASQNISSQQQTEILEQLEVLSTQATLAPTQRKTGLIKRILSALAIALSAGGGLAEIWSKWGNVISKWGNVIGGFFGIHG